MFLIHFLDALTVEGFWAATLFIGPGVVGADGGVGVGAGDGSLRTSGSLSLGCTLSLSYSRWEWFGQQIVVYKARTLRTPLASLFCDTRGKNN